MRDPHALMVRAGAAWRMMGFGMGDMCRLCAVRALISINAGVCGRPGGSW
jgi:hypothetical protein